METGIAVLSALALFPVGVKFIMNVLERLEKHYAQQSKDKVAAE